MKICTNCGYEVETDARFCKHCGTMSTAFSDLSNEEAPTLNLPQSAPTQQDASRPTEHLNQGQTAAPGLPTGPAYVPPDEAYKSPQTDFSPPPNFPPTEPSGYPPPPNFSAGYPQAPTYPSAVDSQPPFAPPNYYQPAPGYMQPVTPPPPVLPISRTISLGDWLSGGWRVYKENWFLMSLATLLVGVVGIGTLGILIGPMLMGLYRMAFRTMKGERPEINDLFNWEGRFLQAFLAFLIYAAIYGGLSGIGKGNALSAILKFAVMPLMTMIFGLALPMILDRKADIAAAINDIGKKIFTKDTLMWWIVGLVFGLIASSGIVGCGLGLVVTVPWIISALAVAYSSLFGLDDPNRTMN
ncbi:MAG: zinc-ribbon domain-containing protein [Acidobacteria bacterium]|nr:zinc-ribbon domain-containing protein [Acidobacteriota bacterium]